MCPLCAATVLLLQVRVGDRVYVCSTGSGTILELSYPDMTLVRPVGSWWWCLQYTHRWLQSQQGYV